ncbi:MAG: hypothetical protein MJ170_03215 [Alphaproteobacteria bacterium]|nr:hypothetical protein [Alphaproteobacteria bacterium]
MQNQRIQDLSINDITSEVFTIAPTQIEYIAKTFGDTVANTMNMRAFAGKIRQIAELALRNALNNAKHMGE